MPSKNNIPDFVKETNNKLIKLNEKFTLSKTKHGLVQNELNKLSEKVKPMSTKELIENSINKYSVLNNAKYFSSGVLKNYQVFISANKSVEFFIGTDQIFKRS